MKTKKRTSPGPAPRGGIPRQCPPIRELFPPKRGLCPKKVTSSVPLECSLRPETLKRLVVTLEFVSKNCFFFFADFAIKIFFLWFHPRNRENSCIFLDEDLFFWSLPQNLWKFVMKTFAFLVHTLDFEALNFSCPTKICLCSPPPPSYAILSPGQDFTKI